VKRFSETFATMFETNETEKTVESYSVKKAIYDKRGNYLKINQTVITGKRMFYAVLIPD